VEPALRLQAFLEESAAAAREGLFTARGLPHGLGGARWAANFLERYRGETVLLKPPQPVQRALIALLARDSSPRRRSCWRVSLTRFAGCRSQLPGRGSPITSSRRRGSAKSRKSTI
jgi:hypothetical protein